MKRCSPALPTIAGLLAVAAWCAVQAEWTPVAQPPPTAQPTADAVVLFDGVDTSAWHQADGQPCRWQVAAGALEVVPGTGNLVATAEFGDCQLHLEFMTPSMPDQTGQARGNSGVYLHGLYEVQILDSFGLADYQDNDCGGIYKVAKAWVNACLPPETWQSYDILFRAPVFNQAGEKVADARLSVLQNGVWIHHHVAVPGPTTAAMRRTPSATGPLMLQDHGNRVRYRNVWLRPLPPRAPGQVAVEQQPAPAPSDAVVLFDGQDTAAWQHGNGRPCAWQVADGALTLVPRTGDLVTKERYGDLQLHLEFRIPAAVAEGTGRGNSGVYLHNFYEIQIIDSSRAATPGAGDCGALYRVTAPMANACLPPDTWQSYDILLLAPKLDEAGNVTEPGHLSVLQNGVWVQDDAPLAEGTGSHSGRKVTADGPILLQDHGNAIEYRNIWVRQL